MVLYITNVMSGNRVNGTDKVVRFVQPVALFLVAW
jgi:hypothetical protein